MDDRPAKMRKFDCMAACRVRSMDCGGITLGSDDTNCYLVSWDLLWGNDNSSTTEDADYITYRMWFESDFPYIYLDINPTSNRVGEFGFMNPVPPIKPPYPSGPHYGAYWTGLNK